MEDLQAAQAARLITALRAQLKEMAGQLACTERKAATARTSSAASSMRAEATALRRDIDEALGLIERLQRCYFTHLGVGPSSGRLSHQVAGAPGVAQPRAVHAADAPDAIRAAHAAKAGNAPGARDARHTRHTRAGKHA
jgi:hypothetical protein